MIYTIGHSNLSKPDFLNLLGDRTLIDIRSHPESVHQQFELLELENWIEDYKWFPGLGGWREDHLILAEYFKQFDVDITAYKGKFPRQRICKKRKDVDLNNTSWTNYGLWDYQFFMTLPEFKRDADDLIELASNTDVAIMCCECLWWKCHRSMVADYLTFRGVESIHLQPKLTKHSTVIKDRLKRYHPMVLETWNRTISCASSV